MMLSKLKTALLGAAIVGFASPAFAQSNGIGEIATNFRTDAMGPIADLAGSAAFVGGVIAAITGLWMLWNHKKNPHDPNSSVGKAVISFIVAAGLIAIPSYLGAGVATFFGTGAETTSVDGSLRSIN